MRRHGRLELILTLPDGSRSLIPAAWTDLEAPVEPARAGTLALLDDLLGARRLLDGLLGRAVLAGEDDRPQPSSEETGGAAATRSRGAAPAAALWELLGEEQRRTALVQLAALIAQTVAGEEDRDE